MYFHNVAGTGSYTTSTTNMYRLHVLLNPCNRHTCAVLVVYVLLLVLRGLVVETAGATGHCFGCGLDVQQKKQGVFRKKEKYHSQTSRIRKKKKQPTTIKTWEKMSRKHFTKEIKIIFQP